MRESPKVDVPGWFTSAVLELFALYPGAAPSKATVVAWWRHLGDISTEALVAAFRKAPSQSMQFCPTAPLVREIALAAAKSMSGPKPDLSRRALPEAPPELPADHPLRDELAAINAKVRAGQLRGPEVARAVVRLVMQAMR